MNIKQLTFIALATLLVVYLTTLKHPVEGSHSQGDWRATVPRDVQLISVKLDAGAYCFPQELARISAFIDENGKAWNDFCNR